MQICRRRGDSVPSTGENRAAMRSEGLELSEPSTVYHSVGKTIRSGERPPIGSEGWTPMSRALAGYATTSRKVLGAVIVAKVSSYDAFFAL